MNNDYPISKPVYIKCKSVSGNIYVPKDSLNINISSEFKSEMELLMIRTLPIYFDKDKYNIRNDAVLELNKVVNILNKYPKLIIEVRAHTDSRADDSYNLILSNQRAISSVQWILNKGIDQSRISGKGFGETQLVNKCSNRIICLEDEHQLNRRTEFVIINSEILNEEQETKNAAYSGVFGLWTVIYNSNPKSTPKFLYVIVPLYILTPLHNCGILFKVPSKPILAIDNI